ncbi:MAG: cytochrome c oxidase subunit II [Rhodomicrobium sp.]
MKARFGALAFLGALAILASLRSAYAFEGVPHEWQIDLPRAGSPLMESMRSFNILLLAVIVPIVVFVMGLLLWVIVRYRESANPVPSRNSHNTTLEVLWTIVPVLILVVIAIPSFRLLFEQYDFPKADVVVKAIGKQWYWSYEYPDDKIAFDSFPVEDKDLKPGQLRNLAVDNEMVVPVNKVVQVLTTGADVIHQWVIPEFGSRVDAMPGRVNRTWFIAKETGTYYGECSALCGQGHAYMPIAVKVVNDDDYRKWLSEKQKTASAQTNSVAAADGGQLAAR